MADLLSWVSLWVCLVLAQVFIAVRIILRRFRRQAFTPGDYWCIAAAIFILARLILNHILLVYGSTRTLSTSRRLELMDGDHDYERFKIVTGSKLVLCTRTLLICILWSAKMAVLDLLSRLIIKMPFERKLLYTFWAALFLTFVASIVTVFTSCTPVERNWQINPNPGDCTIGSIWIWTYEICNMMTDLLLMTVPLSLIMSAKIPTMQRLRILLLFSIGILLISISAVRIKRGRNSRSQAGHTLWASLEVLLASTVAVVPTIYALARNTSHGTSYGKSMDPNKTLGSKVHSGSVVDGDKYTTRVWTELEDNTSKEEKSSATVILVHKSFQTANAKVWSVDRS